jgi:NAD(P)-dependent dehydrogenase (short-subunit alcohol dehydrogenase family)
MTTHGECPSPDRTAAAEAPHDASADAGSRSTLISGAHALEQLAPELRRDRLGAEAVAADIEDLDGYRATLERSCRRPGAPGVTVYNAALPDPGEILETTINRLRAAYDVDVLGAGITREVNSPCRECRRRHAARKVLNFS